MTRGEVSTADEDLQRRALTDAAALWEQVRDEGVPRMLLLVGPPGVGKTWVIQQLYTRLAAEQARPAYWPRGLGVEEATALQSRGRLVPRRFTSPPRAVPSFGWVGISCRLDDGVPVRALEPAVATAEEQHGPVVDPPGLWARLRAGLWRPLLGALLVIAGLVTSLLDLLGIGGLLLSLVGLALVVLELGQLRTLMGHLRAWWQARRRHRDDAEVDETVLLHRARERGLALQHRFRRARIPAVWVVDDAAWADTATVDLLRGLLSSDEAVLVVATTRPDPFESQLRTRSGFGQVVAQFPDRSTRVDLRALPDAALGEIVRARGPGTDPAILRRLVRWCGGNPLVLVGLLEMDAMRARRHEGAYRWELADLDRFLAELAPTIDEVFGVYWSQLPASVRRLLSCAVLQGDQISAGALCVSGSAVLAGDPVAELDRARDPYSWLQPVDEHLDRFADPALLGIAERRAGETLSPDEREAARRRLLDHVADLRGDRDRWVRSPLAVRAVLLRAHVAAARERFVPPDHTAASCALELAGLEERPEEARLSAHHAELAARWATHEDEDEQVWLRASLLAAERHLEAGRGDRAEPAAAAVLERVPEDDPSRGRRRLEAWRLWCLALGAQGRDAEAAHELEGVVVASRRALGADDPDTLENERHLAHWLGRAGRADEALERFEDLVVRHEQRLGPSAVDTLIARSMQAYLVGEVGRIEDAVGHYRALVADRARALGPRDPDTLWSRNNLATMLGRSGQVREAIALFERVVRERDRELGADHPHTLKSRENLAHWLAVDGRVDEAVRLLEHLVAESRLALGEDHPKTRRVHEALEHWRDVVADERPV